MAELLIALALFAGFGNPSVFPYKSLTLPSSKVLKIRLAEPPTEQDQYLAYQAELERRRLRDERIVQRRAKYGNKATNTALASGIARKYSNPKLDISKQIDMRIFTPEMTLNQALDEIQNAGLPLVIIWSDLRRNAFVDENTPIGLQARGLTNLTHALKLVLLSVSQQGSKVGYSVDKGVVTVATKQFNFAKRQLKVYNVSELTNPPWLFPQNNNSYGRSRQGSSGYSSSRNGSGSTGN